MNKLVVVKICIVLSHILILVNITTAKRGLRDSASCKYVGMNDRSGGRCRKDKVKFEKLPKECSAYIYDGIWYTSDTDIIPKNPDEDFESIKSLINLKDNDDDSEPSHDVYVLLKHDSIKEFGKSIYFRDVEVEVADEVKKFIKDHPVKGLILEAITHPFTFQESDNFYKNFTAYVTSIKTRNPGLEIGFYLSARNLITVTMDGKSSYRFDFVKMNDVLDFYLIEFFTFNECVDQLLYGGVTPIDSSDDKILTLNMFADIFKDCTIDKEKVYFEFLISPIVKPEFEDQYWFCETTYNEYCENREKYQSQWCVDNQDVLYEKGKFAKQYSKGFVGRSIDLVDRDNNCNCEDGKYITFFMMLRGFFSDENKLTCDAYK